MLPNYVFFFFLVPNISSTNNINEILTTFLDIEKEEEFFLLTFVFVYPSLP